LITPRYILSNCNTSTITAGDHAIVTFSSIQFATMPDRIFIFARKPLSTMTCKDSESFFFINNISVNLNAVSGLLSSAKPHQLWKMSVENGLNMSWYEWSGKVNRLSNTLNASVLVQDTVYTTGSILVLDPSKDLSLPAYLSNSSIGQFSIQFQIELYNNFSENLAPEIVVVMANSGFLETMSGQTSYFVGLLNKELELDAQKEGAPKLNDKGVRRMIGGGLNEMASNAMHKLPFALRQDIELYKRPIIGGVGSGGVKSGGKRPKKLDSFV
jgi:hypothetical protein